MNIKQKILAGFVISGLVGSSFCFAKDFKGVGVLNDDKNSVTPEHTVLVSKNPSKNVNKPSLSNWCILPKEITKINGPKDMPDHGIKPVPAKHLHKKELWVRSGNRCVAVVRVELDGSVILNPRNSDFDYGPIPVLSHITKMQTDELWGTANKSVSGEVISYKLSSYKEQPTEVFIDVVFDKDKLQKYRIRSSLIKTQKWSLVKKQEEGAYLLPARKTV